MLYKQPSAKCAGGCLFDELTNIIIYYIHYHYLPGLLLLALYPILLRIDFLFNRLANSL
jgi:hypothetical protein